MKPIKTILGLGMLGSWLGLAAAAWAAGTTGAEFLRIQVPAGVAAVGADSADGGGEAALNGNPAGLAGQAAPSLLLTHFSSLVDTAYEQVEGYVPDWLGGAWAARLFYVSTYNFSEIDETGASVGALENYDLLLHAAHAREWFPGFTTGAGLKLFESALAGFHSHGAAVDLGARYAPVGSFWALGAGLANLGAKTAFDQEADTLPQTFFAGVSGAWRLGAGHRVKVLADLLCPLVSGESTVPRLGLEYSLYDLVFLRGGYRADRELGALSLGAGLHWANWGIDYAYQPFGSLGVNHRFSLSYLFKELPENAQPVQSSELSPVPSLEGKKSLAGAYEPSLKALTPGPREWESNLTFKGGSAASGDPKVRGLEIRTAQGVLVKSFQFQNGVPADFRWDGRNETGQFAASGEHYAYHWIGTQSGPQAKTLPQLLPVLKLFFADGAVLEPQAEFEFVSKPQVRAWSLEVRDLKTNQTIQTFSGEALPEHLLWDGKAQSGAWAPPEDTYAYRLSLEYPDGEKIELTDKILPIKALRVEAPAGRVGLLIPGLLFDFNSAVLKPEMGDKLTVASQILRRHAGQAEAECEGHADDIGSRIYNQHISQQRAVMAAKYLETSGVPPEALFVRGFGQDQPVDTRGTEEARAQNRRVEIRIFIAQP